MPIYKQNGNKLLPIREIRIDLEKTVQGLVETNIEDVFGFQFVTTEFALNNLRIDTLAFDEEANCFVVIEYKRDKSFSVVDQGYAYLALMLNNKADFVLEYNERCKKNLRKDDIDWSQSRVIFVAQSFTKYQQEAMGFQDLPIELWEVRQYNDNLILFNELRASEKNESIKTVAKTKGTDTVTTEIRQYLISDHIKPDWKDAAELFEDLVTQMQLLDQRFEVHPVKSHIGFKLGNKNVINVAPGRSRLRVDLLRTKPEDVNDPEKRVKYLENSFKNWNQHVSVVNIANTEDMNYAIMLIKQVYKRFVDLQ
jgi:predicted transport protein